MPSETKSDRSGGTSSQAVRGEQNEVMSYSSSSILHHQFAENKEEKSEMLNNQQISAALTAACITINGLPEGMEILSVKYDAVSANGHVEIHVHSDNLHALEEYAAERNLFTRTERTESDRPYNYFHALDVNGTELFQGQIKEG